MRLLASLVLSGFLLPAASAAAAIVPLAEAAARGDRDAVRALLQQGTDVDAPAVDGTTALHAAVHGDFLDIADALLRAGANASVTDRYGVTPLFLACVNGNAAMVRRLLDAGADPNAADPGGETALMTAARTGEPGRAARAHRTRRPRGRA